MSSFTNLLSRLSFINEAVSPLDTLIPGFQKQARGLAAAKGASASTREGKLALLTILYDLDIIDDSVVRMFKNDPSVSRLVAYFEQNGIAKAIKARKDDIQNYIKDKLEDKISFTTGNRTDAAMQRMEVNKLNTELKAAKKVARIERKKDTAAAMSAVSQVVDNYADLVGSIQGSYSEDYMIELVADKSSDLGDINNIVNYLKQFVKESDIDVEGRSIDATFSKDSKLGKIITRLGAEKVESQISDDLEKYGGVGVVIHTPDIQAKPNMNGNIGQEEEEGYEEEAEDEEGFTTTVERLEEFGISTPRYTNGKIPDIKNSNTVTEGSVLNYMSEQRVYSSPKPIVESISFRDKFKPQTSKQLAELKSYGM
jgi:hypothetical protein